MVCLLIFGSCGQDKKYPKDQNKDENLERPAVKSADSSDIVIPVSPPVPDTNSPVRAKKNSKSDLDTLRPIKA